jgi:hypothetical protein
LTETNENYICLTTCGVQLPYNISHTNPFSSVGDKNRDKQTDRLTSLYEFTARTFHKKHINGEERQSHFNSQCSEIILKTLLCY